MLKKRAESKKKKSSANNSKNHKALFASHTDKILFKLSGGFMNVKPSMYSSGQVPKTPKSSTATPSNKLRKQSK